MLKTTMPGVLMPRVAYHLGEGCVLKTSLYLPLVLMKAYHLGEGCVLKTRARVGVKLLLAGTPLSWT